MYFLAYSGKLPGSRVLEDHYGSNLVGLVVPKGQAARLASISEFIERAKASGLVQQAIERAGLPGHQVAPAKTNREALPDCCWAARPLKLRWNQEEAAVALPALLHSYSRA